MTTTFLASYSKRNSTVEMLRFLFIFGILLNHTYGFGTSPYPDQVFALGSSLTTCYHLAVNCIGHVGVTGFVFISGYYGIRVNRRKLLRLVLTTLFYVMLIDLLFRDHLQLEQVRGWMHAFDFNWFVGCYIVLCLLAPLIESGIQHASQRLFRHVVIGLLLYTYVAHYIGFNNDHDLSLLLTVYVVGRYVRLRLSPQAWVLRRPGLLALLSTMVIALVPVAFSMAGAGHYPVMRLIAVNNNVLLLLLSASLVVWADRHATHNRVVNYLATSVLAIYLITDNKVIYLRLTSWLYPQLLAGYGFAVALVVCLGCLLVDKVWQLLLSCLINAVPSRFPSRLIPHSHG